MEEKIKKELEFHKVFEYFARQEQKIEELKIMIERIGYRNDSYNREILKRMGR
jgi:hypothetical protein